MRGAAGNWAICLVAAAMAVALVACGQEEPNGTVFPDVPTPEPVPTEYHVDFAPGERALCDVSPIRERIAEAVESAEVGSVLPRPQDLEGLPGNDPKELYQRWQQLSDEERVLNLCLNLPTEWE